MLQKDDQKTLMFLARYTNLSTSPALAYISQLYGAPCTSVSQPHSLMTMHLQTIFLLPKIPFLHSFISRIIPTNLLELYQVTSFWVNLLGWLLITTDLNVPLNLHPAITDTFCTG